jgi:hypothetical protein
MRRQRSLVGVECVPCRASGHRCQAQIWIDAVATCLRCANEEPCVYVTARLGAKPEPEPVDPCIVPKVTRADREAIREMTPAPSIYDGRYGLDEATRRAILNASRKISSAKLAEKYHLSRSTVLNLRARARREELERIIGVARECAMTPLEQRIGGEDVKMAPAVVMGAEMIERKK